MSWERGQECRLGKSLPAPQAGDSHGPCLAGGDRMGGGGKSVSALSPARLGLGGGAAAQPLVAWLQREGEKGRAGFPTEAEDCKQRRPL